MADIRINRQYRALLFAIDLGHVHWSSNGDCLLWRRKGHGQHTRADLRVRELEAAGLVVSTGDHSRPYELTDAGRTAKDAAP